MVQEVPGFSTKVQAVSDASVADSWGNFVTCITGLPLFHTACLPVSIYIHTTRRTIPNPPPASQDLREGIDPRLVSSWRIGGCVAIHFDLYTVCSEAAPLGGFRRAILRAHKHSHRHHREREREWK
jgi:hypothetical protein